MEKEYATVILACLPAAYAQSVSILLGLLCHSATQLRDRQFRRLMAPVTNCAFNGYSHPVLGSKERRYFRETLAWARLDVDLESGQALVEEIQSDWVRRVKDAERRLKRWEASSRPKTGRRTTQNSFIQLNAYQSDGTATKAT